MGRVRRCRGYGEVPHWDHVIAARAADWVLSSPACRLLCRAADHVSTHDNRHWPHPLQYAPPTRPCNQLTGTLPLHLT